MITATIIETEKQLIYEIHSISKAVHYTITLEIPSQQYQQ